MLGNKKNLADAMEKGTGTNFEIVQRLLPWWTHEGSSHWRSVMLSKSFFYALLTLHNSYVAAQESAYLANCFNRMEHCEKYPEGPLRFKGTGHHSPVCAEFEKISCAEFRTC
ncbi:hypothetical protein Patl1_34890 [Pistacia atlantica]|uniref:Uncharacterized protein n=1 Tax=Pistacia atlantica TaxID=434234 RepID=A0ACC0ZS19_9ROSI|nr:hypothetical protein Patl1_34890 [Pistacia atlantica]